MAHAVATGTDIDTLCVNTIRTLSIDAIQKANSGHPGTPIGSASHASTVTAFPRSRERGTQAAQHRSALARVASPDPCRPACRSRWPKSGESIVISAATTIWFSLVAAWAP